MIAKDLGMQQNGSAMNFGQALEILRRGGKVARTG